MFTYHRLIPVITIMFLSFTVLSLSANDETVIIHFNALKEAKLEGNAKSICFIPVLAVAGETPYIKLMNELKVARQVSVRILDLAESEYDLYIDGKYIGKKTRQCLEDGISVSFTGTWITKQYTDYYNRVRQRCLDTSKRYEVTLDDDAQVCYSILQGVASWVDAIEKADMRMRTVSIIVTPADKAFSLPGGGMTVAPNADFNTSIQKVGHSIHVARGSVVKRVKDSKRRLQVLEALTPVEMKLSLPKKFIPGKKVAVYVNMVNYTDRTVSGKVRLDIPAGWKAYGKQTFVKMKGYSKSAQAKFLVLPPKAVSPKLTIGTEADIKVQDIALRLSSTITL